MTSPLASTVYDPYNGFAHRNMQTVDGNPTGVPRNMPTHPGAKQSAGDKRIKLPAGIDSSTTGRRTNALAQYARVVAMEGNIFREVYDELMPYSTVFAARDHKTNGHGIDVMSQITSLAWINEQLRLAPVPIVCLRSADVDLSGVDVHPSDGRVVRVCSPAWGRWVDALELPSQTYTVDQAKKALVAARILDAWFLDGVLQSSELTAARNGETGSSNLIFNVGVRGPSQLRNGSDGGVLHAYQLHEFDPEVRVRDDLLICLHLLYERKGETATFEYKRWSSRRLWKAGRSSRSRADMTPAGVAADAKNPDRRSMRSIVGAWRVGSVVDSKAAVAPNQYGAPTKRSIQVVASIDGRWMGLYEMRERYGLKVVSPGETVPSIALGGDWGTLSVLGLLHDRADACIERWTDGVAHALENTSDPFRSVLGATRRAWNMPSSKKKKKRNGNRSPQPDVSIDVLVESMWRQVLERGEAEAREANLRLEDGRSYDTLLLKYADAVRIVDQLAPLRRFFTDARATVQSRQRDFLAKYSDAESRFYDSGTSLTAEVAALVSQGVCEEAELEALQKSSVEYSTQIQMLTQALGVIASLSAQLGLDMPGTTVTPNTDALRSRATTLLANLQSGAGADVDGSKDLQEAEKLIEQNQEGYSAYRDPDTNVLVVELSLKAARLAKESWLPVRDAMKAAQDVRKGLGSSLLATSNMTAEQHAAAVKELAELVSRAEAILGTPGYPVSSNATSEFKTKASNLLRLVKSIWVADAEDPNALRDRPFGSRPGGKDPDPGIKGADDQPRDVLFPMRKSAGIAAEPMDQEDSTGAAAATTTVPTSRIQSFTASIGTALGIAPAMPPPAPPTAAAAPRSSGDRMDDDEPPAAAAAVKPSRGGRAVSVPKTRPLSAKGKPEAVGASGDGSGSQLPRKIMRAPPSPTSEDEDDQPPPNPGGSRARNPRHK